MSPDNTGKKQARTGGGHFRKGASGNPGGRPAGTRNKALLAIEALLDGEAEAITRIAVEKAKEGDATALRLCLERILPPRKDRPVSFSLPQLGTVTDAPAATAAIVAAVAAADITVTEGSELARLVDTYVRAVEASDLDKRLRAIEEKMTK
jgi:Family of unknown function (DUF5681)